MRRLLIAILTAAILWFVMFSPWTAPMLNFWYAMTFSAVVLISLSVKHIPKVQQGFRGIAIDAMLGLVIAFLLWWLFWVGDKMSGWLFDFARPQVDMIYGMKDGTYGWLIALFLLFVIGPAEELFWRGYIQRELSERYGGNAGFLLCTAVYTLIHVPSGNFMLVMSALVCGLAWGGLYRLYPRHFLAIVISHSLWDAAAFVWFPI